MKAWVHNDEKHDERCDGERQKKLKDFQHLNIAFDHAAAENETQDKDKAAGQDVLLQGAPLDQQHTHVASFRHIASWL
jgi:hypothetical protein